MYQVFFEENAMSTVPKFRIDVNVHSLLMNSTRGPELPANQGVDPARADLSPVPSEAVGSRTRDTSGRA